MGPVTDELRTLVVMRHATARGSAASDFERDLTPQGHEDAVSAGVWLRDAGVEVDHAVVSAAVRTRQTWEGLRSGAGWSLESEVEAGLYSAGPEAGLDMLRLVPNEARTVLLVGHNPTVAQLSQLLSDGLGQAHDLSQMAQGCPPAAMTVFQITGEWAELGFGDARVTGFHVARG